MSQSLFDEDSRFIQRLDEAVSAADAEEITNRVRRLLCDVISNNRIRLPKKVYEAAEGHYARRLMYRSPEHGYSVVAMTWGPGQGTPVHDHSGMWCVEGIWEGIIEVTQYELMAEKDGLYNFESRGSLEASIGSAGSLIPPHEYHTICNPDDTQVAVSIHIYSGDMTSCRKFTPIEGEDDWYEPTTCSLSFDDVLDSSDLKN